jgi:hypothetical protein
MFNSKARVGLFLALFYSVTSLAAETQIAIIGDAGEITSSSKKVRESISRMGVRKLALPGDNLYSGTYEAAWSPWRNAGLTFDLVAIGNHNAGYRKEMNFFAMPGEYYAKAIGNSLFIVLNSDNDRSAAEQAAWLNRELAAASQPNVFLIYHHPSYTVSAAHTWSEKPNFQRAIRSVIWTHRPKITALIVGHDHLASLIHFGDLPVILSGAVHDLRRDRPVDYMTDGIRIKTAWFFDRNAYWARLTVDDAGGATVDFIRASDDNVSCTANLQTGSPAVMHRNCEASAIASARDFAPGKDKPTRTPLRGNSRKSQLDKT